MATTAPHTPPSAIAQARDGFKGDPRANHKAAIAGGENDQGLLAATLPSTLEIAGTLIILLYYGISLSYGAGAIHLANIVGPTALSLTLLITVYRMLTINRFNLWSPLVWYRAAVIGYFGIGTLVPLFLNSETRRLIEGFFEFFPTDVMKFNIVVALFHMVMLVTMTLVLTPFTRRIAAPNFLPFVAPCNLRTQHIGFMFIGIGAPMNYLLVYPAMLKLISITLPNAVLQLSNIAYLGYFLVSYWALQNKRYRWIWAIFALSSIDSAVGIINLTKSATILPIIMLPIAYLFYRVSLRRLTLVVALILPFYFSIADIISDARMMVARTDTGRPVLSDSIHVLSELAAGKENITQSQEAYQISWARLSYVNAGSFAISQYDQGLPGDSLRDIFVVWIPRAFYPDKPIITALGYEFTALATGNDQSSSSPSIPAEAYWVLGWPGVILFAFITGTILSLWSVYNLIALQREAWHLLLVVVLGLRIGSRIDGVLVVDMIGPISAAVAAHFVFFFANRLLPMSKGDAV